MDMFLTKNWKGMICPRSLEQDSDSSGKNYGKFVIKPLERGYGLTLGNSLRRVLLSSLQGAGIVAIKIDGVDHEFGTIQNIKEEVSEIILNLKELKFKLINKEEVFVVLEKSGEGSVTGMDVQTDTSVEMLNPDHVICNISSGGSIRVELKVSRGKGYVMASDNQEMHDSPVGWIYLDTLFSPVTRVNYTVTNARVGKRTDYDCLTLEVWTNSGVDSHDAVAFAAKILRDQLMVFLNFEDKDELVQVDTDTTSVVVSPRRPGGSHEAFLRPVSELELSVRSANCLQNANIKYIYELVSKTEGEMLRTKNFGRKSLNEIKEILNRMGLGLGMKVDSVIKEMQE